MMEMENDRYIYMHIKVNACTRNCTLKLQNEEITDSRMGMRDSCVKFFPFSASVSSLPSVWPILPASGLYSTIIMPVKM